MDKILLHVAGIALLEIIFYFSYIGPMETKIFKDTFGSSLGNSLSTQDPNSPFHFSNNITTILQQYKENRSDDYENQLKKESDNSEKERDKDNSNLFAEIMGYLMLTFLIIIFIHIFKRIYIYYNSPPEGFTRELSIHDIEENYPNDNNNLIPRPNQESKCWKYFLNFIYYFTLAGLILLFEYIFFQYIVLKYHIISSKEIEYIVYTQFIDSLGREITYLL